MGVDTKITLPPYARVRDVADTIGILLGLPPEKQMFRQDSSGGWGVRVPGVKIEEASVDTLLWLRFEGEMLSGLLDHWDILWHLEWGNDGSRGTMPRSSCVSIALGRALVDFWGGHVDYDDCDDKQWDFAVPYWDARTYPPPWGTLPPSDGDAWYAFQEAKLTLEPITEAEVETAEGLASYKWLSELRRDREIRAEAGRYPDDRAAADA